MRNVRYSIVIPVYKSVNSLIELAKRINAVFENLKETYELIFVNDSPYYIETDNTLKQIANNSDKIVYIKLSKNFGQQPATLCGIAHSTGDYVITMDDDLQHAPEDIPKLIEKKDDHKIVIASFNNKKHNLFKIVTSKIKGYFDYLLIGKPKHIKLSSFRLISRNVANGVHKIKTPYPFIPALIFLVSNDIVNVDVEHKKREEGKSNYTLSRMFSLFSNLIINNSSLLLKLIGYLGIFSFCAASFFAFLILYKKLSIGTAIAGWSSTMVAILFFGGLNLLAIGIVGEYLIRIMTTSENRPTYFVDKVYK